MTDFVWQALGFLHDQPLEATPEKVGAGPRLNADLLAVLELLKSGNPTRGAAKKLGLEPAEFRRRVKRIYRKYEVENRVGLLAALLARAE